MHISTKKEQFGFRAVIKQDDKECVMVCLGDEPCYTTSEKYVKNADWLLSEAYHTEDSDLENRAIKYTEEVMQSYTGNIFVPDDLEVIRIL